MTWYFDCEHCGNRTPNYKNIEGMKYCSSKCRQAAYRASKRKSLPDDKFACTPTEKAIVTKRDQARLKECAHCRQYFEINGLQHARKYCSDACQQAEYRDRRKWRDGFWKEWQARIKTADAQQAVEIDPMDTLRSQWVDIAEEQASLDGLTD